eukprot:COSAG04_NODE_968_length_9110_cov_6.799911_8_plen_60_part_00
MIQMLLSRMEESGAPDGREHPRGVHHRDAARHGDARGGRRREPRRWEPLRKGRSRPLSQ